MEATEDSQRAPVPAPVNEAPASAPEVALAIVPTGGAVTGEISQVESKDDKEKQDEEGEFAEVSSGLSANEERKNTKPESSKKLNPNASAFGGGFGSSTFGTAASSTPATPFGTSGAAPFGTSGAAPFGTGSTSTFGSSNGSTGFGTFAANASTPAIAPAPGGNTFLNTAPPGAQAGAPSFSFGSTSKITLPIPSNPFGHAAGGNDSSPFGVFRQGGSSSPFGAFSASKSKPLFGQPAKEEVTKDGPQEEKTKEEGEENAEEGK